MTDMINLLIEDMTAKARTAARVMSRATNSAKTAALIAVAEHLRASSGAILAANALDMDAGTKAGLSSAMLDRLRLDNARLSSVADAVEAVAHLTDPVGEVISHSERPNGLVLERVRVPIGVLAIIYESRPNVTADAAALALRSGNAVILRGGSEAANSNRAIHAAMVTGFEVCGYARRCSAIRSYARPRRCGGLAARARVHRHGHTARRQIAGGTGAR